jgi:hypothetical protein
VFVASGIQHSKRMRNIVICGFSSLNIFPRYLINGTIFEKKFSNLKCVLTFYKFLFETFLIVRRNGRDMIKNVYWSSCTVPVIIVYIGLLHVQYRLLLSGFNETWIFSIVFFLNYPNLKFNENPSSGSRVVPSERTGRHDEDNSRFTQFFECV